MVIGEVSLCVVVARFVVVAAVVGSVAAAVALSGVLFLVFAVAAAVEFGLVG